MATFAVVWALAARSPHTLVYLPLRAGARPDGCDRGRPLDLLLLHHRLGFPPSRWKEVRARLGAGTPQTVRLPAGAWPERPTAAHERARHRGFRDHLRWAVAADTLVLTGSREAFDLQAERILELAEQCPAHRARSPEGHCCAELDMGRFHDPFARLHAELCR